MLCHPKMSPIKGIFGDHLQSTGPGTGFAPLVSDVTGSTMMLA
jgi:hypothetical protein